MYRRVFSIVLFGAVGALAAVVGLLIAEGGLALLLIRESDTAPFNQTGVEPGAEVRNSAPPAISKELDGRLTPRGAKTGDVQISLLWNDTNDLDLHCIGPDGHEIYPGTKDTPSPTGGIMDLDANASCYAPELTNTPVENIYWTTPAPAGTYRVYVSVYQRCEPTASSTPFRVSVLANGHRSELDGTATHADRKGKQLVSEFTVERSAAPASAAPVAAPTDKMSAPKHAARPAPMSYGLWAVLLVASVAAALLSARNRYACQKPLLTLAHHARIGAVAVTGFIGVWIGQVLDRQLHPGGAVGVGSAVGWVLLASFSVLIVSSAPPKMDVKKRALVGLFGGLLALGVFFVGADRAEWLGRGLGGVVVGASCGVALGATVGRQAERPTPLEMRKPTAPPPVVPVAIVPPAVQPSPPVSPPVPAATPRPVSPPAPASGGPALAPDACPYCRNGIKHPGPPGERYCIFSDRKY